MSTKHIECASMVEAERIIERMQETFKHVEFMSFVNNRLFVAYC